MSTREKISAMRFSDPTISGATLAAKLGVSRQRVAQILRELGLETRVVKKSAIRLRNRPEYKCWWNMIDRCTNPENKRYRYYGARGISVCDRWTSFRNFYADMGP